jgi:hypothetical protein
MVINDYRLLSTKLTGALAIEASEEDVDGSGKVL